jgi:hypothetical protein
MYPLHNWGYQQIIERIHRLNSNELFYESVIASAQVYEQVLKRILRNELAKQGVMLAKKNTGSKEKGIKTKPSNSLRQIDGSVRYLARSATVIHEQAWDVAMNAPNANPSLDKLIKTITSEKELRFLLEGKKMERIHWPDSILAEVENSGIDSIRCGLIHMRHEILHGANAADIQTVRVIAFFGESFLAKLLCPSNGIASQGIRDPLKKCSAFRKQV